MAGRREQTAGRCRWKQGRSWRYGHLDSGHVLERDGSLRVYDDNTGGARSLRLHLVWHESRGPRGGLRWVPSTLAPVVIAATDAAHKPDQLGLFGESKS